MGVAPEAIAKKIRVLAKNIHIVFSSSICGTLGTIVLNCSSRSSNGSSPRVHEGVCCDLLYFPILFLALLFILVALHVLYICCHCFIFCSGQNVKARRFIWTCNLLSVTTRKNPLLDNCLLFLFFASS
jgi:hypothetical protein